MAPLDAPTTAALAERLAFVCDAVAAATLGAVAPAGASASPGVVASPGADAPPAEAAPTSGDDDVASFRVRDARGDWEGAVERLAAGARPFALLAVEVDDAPRLAAADAPGAAEALARVERAVRDELRPGDVLGREEDGRLWIVAADLGATGARALAERLADAVAAVPPLRGAALTASIGVAASPAGGADRDELTARADESLYAARAAGVPIA
jgi:GGDEF domain-containing protein